MGKNVLAFDFVAENHFSKTAKDVGNDTEGLAAKVGKFGKATAIAFGTVAAGGVLALGKVFKDGVAAADEYQKVSLKTAAVIKSTGNQAHISVGGVQALAAELEGLGTTDEELIINAQNVIATFTSIRNIGKNRIFDEATKSALDISVALGSDLQGAAIQVGKALNDPIKGVSALSKVGVSFTAQQKEQIKTLVESGKTMDAQKIILAELNKEFGGAAKAAGSGFSGAVFRAKDAIGDLQRDLAMKALPALTGLADWVTDKGVPKLREFSEWMETTGVPRIVKGFEDARAKVEDIWDKLKLGDIGTKIIDQAKAIGTKVEDAAKDWGSLILLGVNVGLQGGDWAVLGRIVADGLGIAFESGTSGGVNLGEVLGKWVALVDWLELGKTLGSTAIPFAIGFSLTLIDGLFTAIKEHPFDVLLAIVTLIPIGKLAAAFRPIRELIEHLPFGTWVTWALDHTAVKAFDAAWRFIKWAGRGIATGFKEIIPMSSGWITRLVRNVGDSLALRALYLADRASAFVQGIFIGIGRMGGRVTAAAGRVIVWLTRPFVNAGRWLVGAGRSLLGGLTSGILDRGATVVRAITGLTSRIIGKFAGAGRWLVLSGRRLLAGLYDGMREKVVDAASWAKNIGGKIVGAVKRFFGIASPSKVFRSMGRNLISSLLTGMVDKNPVRFVSKIFGSMPKALGALVDKGLVSIKGLPVKAMKALSGLGGKFAGLLGFTGAGGGGGGNAQNRALGQIMARSYGWGSGPQWAALNSLIMGESGWRSNAQNPNSTAYGIGQFLDSTWASVGARKTSDPAGQIAAMLKYVSQVYGSPMGAYGKWSSRNPHWYDAGGIASGRGFIGKNTLEPERVLSPAQTRSFDRLTRVLDRRPTGASSAPESSGIDYIRLGDQVAKAFLRAGVSVRMDGRAVGRVLGTNADILGRNA